MTTKEKQASITAWEAFAVATVVATVKAKKAKGDTVSPTNVTPKQYDTSK